MTSLRARAVCSPMRRPLKTSVGSVTTAPLVLLDLETSEGIVGRAYLFAYIDAAASLIRQALGAIAPTLIGAPLEPVELRRLAARPFQLLGTRGIVGLCLSGVDIACWDVIGQAAGLPLCRLLGGGRPPIQAYNSNGLGITSPELAGREAVELLEEGFSAIKVRLGHSDPDDDLEVVRAIREEIPGDAILMTDFNHCLSTPDAVGRGQLLDGEGVYWIEEPTAFDDLRGNAQVARATRTPVQIGENFESLRDMDAAIAAEACDLVMPDLQRIGGVTEWLKAAALAEAAGVPMSSHLFPEVTCHLLAVTPTRHWLEYVDWAEPILSEPLRVDNGHVTIPDRPGTGVEWDEDAVAHYSMD